MVCYFRKRKIKLTVKLSRLIETPDHEDSAIDICGYGALLGEEHNGNR